MSTTTAPGTASEFLALLRKSGLYDEVPFRTEFPSDDRLPADARGCAAAIVRAGLLTLFQAKQLLAGRYRGLVLGTHRILEPIGQGGMGAVYLAEHTGLRRKVALKVLPTDKARDKLALERFYREARAAAALSHPNIVQLHDVGQEGGVHYLVMEYIEGNDLQSLMAKTGPLHHAQAADYIAQAAAGLQHAHDRGIVHRDLKPANLILAKDGTVKLLDLGLARSLTDAKDNLTTNLGDGEVVGTADYIAPEFALGKPSDGRADIYSLGATLYALVAGHPPFSGTTSQKLIQHQLQEPPSLTKKLAGRVPPALAQVISKMMAKRPENRYQTAGDVIDALGPWLPAPSTGRVAVGGMTGRLAAGPLSQRLSTSVAELRRFPKWIFAVAGGALLLTLMAAIWFVSSDSEPVTNPIVPRTNLGPNPPGYVRTPLAPQPGDDQYTAISIADVANVSSNHLLFDPKVRDALVTNDWSDRRIEGVPFTLIPPNGDRPNVIEMYSTMGQAAQMPRTVTIPVGVAASQLHFLSGTGAWGFPWRGDGMGNPLGNVVLNVTFKYASGATEDHRWENGVHFCDYVGTHDVPGSTPGIEFEERRSVRYLALKPQRAEVIKEIEFIKNPDDRTAPLILAVTAEKTTLTSTPSAPPRKAAVEPPTLIPLQLPARAKQPDSPVPAPKEVVKVDGITFEPGAKRIILGPGQSAQVSCFLATRSVHILGTVGTPGGMVRVRFHYSGDQTEEHDWQPDAGTAAGPLRALTLIPKSNAVLQHISFENAGSTTPVIDAVTVVAR